MAVAEVSGEKERDYILVLRCIPVSVSLLRERERERERSPRRHGDRIDPHGPRRYVRNDSQLANSILAR